MRTWLLALAVAAVAVPRAAAADDEPEPDDEPDDETVAIDLDVGLGVTGRRFAATPMTIAGYSSTPVPALRVGGAVHPVRVLALEVGAERTIGMTSRMGDDAAPTHLARWQAAAALTVRPGVAALFGAGRRTFQIDAVDVNRTPDSQYDYVALGARAELPLGARTVLRGASSLQAVVAGEEPTEVLLGPARRWGLEVVAGVELAATRRLRVRLDADYQRFQWSWPSAGARGEGGASDSYLAGYATLGAAY